MPWDVRKRGGKWDIVKLLGGGKEQVVGHSSNEADAKASVRARYAAESGATMGKPKRKFGKLGKYVSR